jgi:hypothetical protein
MVNGRLVGSGDRRYGGGCPFKRMVFGGSGYCGEKEEWDRQDNRTHVKVCQRSQARSETGVWKGDVTQTTLFDRQYVLKN